MKNINNTEDSVAPLIIFTYNRISVLKNTINNLQKNSLIKETDVYVFCDGPKPNDPIDSKKVLDVINYLNNLPKFSKSFKIFKATSNIGLGKSIIRGVTKVSSLHKKFIVLEDDLLVSEYFLTYMNNSLNKFENEKKVWCINGMGINNDLIDIPKDYGFDTYFTHRASSHGWASWSDRWNMESFNKKNLKRKFFRFKFLTRFYKGGEDLIEMLIKSINYKVDSWAILWNFIISNNYGLCLSPINSYVSAQVNSEGTNIKIYIPIYDNNLSYAKKIVSYPLKIEIDTNFEERLFYLYSRKKLDMSKLSKLKFYFFSIINFYYIKFPKFMKYFLKIVNKLKTNI